MKIPVLAPVFVFALSSASVIAGSTTGEVKSPRPLPSMQDVKTPEPPNLMGPGMPLTQPPGSPPVSTTMTHTTMAHTTKPMPGGATSPSRHVIDRVLSTTSANGTIWARGRTYKASFDVGGATYVPFFGARAPTDYPIQLTTKSVSVGATDLGCERTAPTQAGDTIVMAHGGFVERWQMRIDGLEQQFVFDELPSSGDLVIKIGAHTELATSSGHGAIAFSNELGRVDYGAATAIDAAGRRFAMQSVLVDDVIELRLAQDDVARAQLPLVVDPFVSTYPLGDYGTVDLYPDVAYDQSTDRYLVVYEDTYSSSDHDIYMELRDASGGLISFDFVDYTTEYWGTPRVANNFIAHNFMCVASVGLPNSLHTIWGRTIDASTATLGAQFTIAGADGYDKTLPDVGGDPNPAAPTYYLVVWERTYTSTDHDVHGRLVDAAGNLQGPGTILIDNSANTYDSQPDVSKCDGASPASTQDWIIVWQRYNTTYQQYQIYGAQVHWDGNISANTYPIDATSDDDLNPRVSSILDSNGVSRPYMVVFQSRSQSGDWDLTGAMFAGTTFLVGTNIPNYVDLATFSDNQIGPSIDSDGKQFAVAYSEEDPVSLNDFNVIVADLVYAGGYPYVCDHAALQTSPDSDLGSAITSTYSSGGAQQHYLIAWDRINFQFGISDIEGALYDGMPGGCATPFCFGDGSATACPCGNSGASGNGCANSVDPNGGNLTSSGNPEVTADTFVLLASGLPHGGTGLYFQGAFGSSFYGVPFGDGIRCVTSSIRRLGAKSNPSGSSQYPGGGDASISIKGAIPAVGGFACYQLWYRNVGAFCTPAPYNLTNGLEVIWAP